MQNATVKRTFILLLVLTCVSLASCSNPQAERTRQINEARDRIAEGKDQAALALLEDLSTEFPNDGEILELIGEIYRETGDDVSAAFYLEQASLQKPGDTELLYQTYLAKTAADQNAADLLERLAEEAPNTLTPELWVRLGETRAAANRTQPALDAYLRGIDPERRAVKPANATAVGKLFLQLDNLAQAERWFELAAARNDPAAEGALLGLLEIRLRQKQWAAAESTVEQLDRRYPNALDNSRWANAREELQRWRAAQEKMRAERAPEKADETTAETAETTETADTTGPDDVSDAPETANAANANANAANAAAAEEADEPKEAARTNQATASTSAGNPRNEDPTRAPEREGSGGKAQVVADMEAAEALATTPAVEPYESAQASALPGTDLGSAITFNPDIAVQPADPETGVEVTFDQQSEGAPIRYNVDSGNEAAEGSPAATADAAATPPTGEGPQTTRPLSALLADAEAATREGNYDRATQLYWQALGRANTRADIWNRLSRVYLLDDEAENAETAALEATRLAPGDIAYALDYLRVVQRTKEPNVFLGEVETAYARFPRNPELTLSLARAYERISRNYRDARKLYERFIELAPNHPLRPEAESAVARLR